MTEPGLRERKKAATRRRLARAALSLAESVGPDVTVEEICAAVEVSQRTFFNYFSTKEEAILGPPPSPPSDEALLPFEQGGPTGDLLSDLRAVVVPHLDEELPTIEQMRVRHLLMRDHPELAAHMMHGFHAIEHRFVHAAARRFGCGPYDAEAQVVGSLASALVRVWVRAWIRAGGGEIGPHAEATQDVLRDLGLGSTTRPDHDTTTGGAP